MKPLVTILTRRPPELYNSSLLYAGLDGLTRAGEIDLSFRDVGGSNEEPDSTPLTMNLEIRSEPGAKPRKAVIDLADQSDLVSDRLLSWCDVYFKRNLYRPDIAALPGEMQKKIEPFGLNYPCRTAGSARRMLRKYGLRYLAQGAAGLRILRRYMSIPDVRDFEQGPETALQSAVVYQTRVWQSDEFPPGRDESEEINAGRVALVRALKSAFGERFLGGLVPTPLALRRYPDDVATLSSKPCEYIRMSKRNLIAIYARGLFHSTAFKLPECLAAAQCIVAEPPRNELPVPLESGLNYLPFATVDECVGACERLMKDQELGRRMRVANHEYYKRNVSPEARVRRVLKG